MQAAVEDWSELMLPAQSSLQPGVASTHKSRAEFGAELDNEIIKRSIAECKRAETEAQQVFPVPTNLKLGGGGCFRLNFQDFPM